MADGSPVKAVVVSKVSVGWTAVRRSRKGCGNRNRSRCDGGGGVQRHRQLNASSGRRRFNYRVGFGGLAGRDCIRHRNSAGFGSQRSRGQRYYRGNRRVIIKRGSCCGGHPRRIVSRLDSGGMPQSYRGPRRRLPSVAAGFLRRSDGSRTRLVQTCLAVFRSCGWLAPVIRNWLAQVVAALDRARFRSYSARFGTLV